ncbi:scp-like extracellular [Leptolyngbya sp. Heron Island J]|uniref:CAP domain-containing protein n=1 Tax=Leptolyngbya sp. Heron Island J TaxID=1385935 RepID=UPI0003B943B0|nr:CAP domain-containing protein [Leptolyngbya sp. Heron Island J]ESA32232.1 scp-like extracellular [Leptolyngbya sp. Heron Island J]
MNRTSTSSEFAQEVLSLTNEFRAEHGLSPLTMSQELTITAQNYAQLMAEQDFFSHIGTDGSAPWDRAAAQGYTARAVGENIAAGQDTPAEVVREWIRSDSHRQNLLNPDYTELGVGYFALEDDPGQVNYGHYWTQLFGSGNLTATGALEEEDAIAVTPRALENNEDNLVVRVLTLTDEGTVELGDSMHYRLEPWSREPDIQSLLVDSNHAPHAAMALIQVNSHSALTDYLLSPASTNLAIGG